MKISERISLCWRILRAEPGRTMAHAERELPLAQGDEMQALMNRQIKEIVLVFGTHGHSGFSAGYAASVIGRLLRHEPIRPLTGEPDEWHEVSEGVFQNRRCSRVFKQADRFGGQAYDIEGRVFREASGAAYSSYESFVPVVFPYAPSTEYVNV